MGAKERLRQNAFGMGRLMGIIRDEKGVTTVGMAIAISLSLALIFSGAQLYRVSSASGEIQEVADACALAAESEVAEYVTAVNTCDAVLLTLTLLAGTLYGVGIVSACIPPLAELSVKVIDCANKTVNARERFYEGAVKGLNAIQKLVPFLAAANAMGVAQANNRGAMQASYFAASVLVPEDGVELGVDAQDGLLDIGSEVNDDAEDIRSLADDAEEASKKANEAKQRAFLYDCGNSPAYCMHERAGSLSDITESDNPLYTSVDAWSFQVALNRAKAYYSARERAGVDASVSIEEQANASIRKRFYQYAMSQLEDAYVYDDGDSCEIYLPHFFRNTDEMRSSELYSEAVYPVTVNDGGAKTMHAWPGCPAASGYSYLGAVSELDVGGFTECSECEFSISSLGNVASASTSITNGFEHHYEQVRLASVEYVEQRAQADDLKRKVKDTASPLLENIASLFKDAAARRLKAEPPGRAGVITMVVNTAQNAADTGFESLFVTGGATLGTRVAVSGATLLRDETEQSGSAITKIVGTLAERIPALGGVMSIAANCWTSFLKVYESGQEALVDGVEGALNSFSDSTASGLGRWASKTLRDVIGTVGLEPADIKSKLPVLVNTAHVANADDGAFSVNYVKVKNQVLDASAPATGLMSSLASKMRGIAQGGMDSAWLTIASIELPFGTVGQTIEWIVPDQVRSAASEIAQDALDGAESAIASAGGVRSWQ